MVSVEGLWCFQTASVDAPDQFVFGGVVVLESGRVLGGDSAFAFIGDYAVKESQIIAKVRSFQWNGAMGNIENVFGMTGPDIDYVVDLVGSREGDHINGYLSPQGIADVRLPIVMLYMSPLP